MAQSLGKCGSYDLLVELAAGGMATVYLARGSDGRLVAIKRPHKHLAKDKGFLSMLVDEARLASSVQHDHVVRVRELAFEAGEPFIVLDYVEGAAISELRAELRAHDRTIEPRLAVRMALDALAGLHAAHVLTDSEGRPLGIIHRDVSPHNILVGCDGQSHVTDFGIAKAVDRVQTTKTHEVKGKLAYLSPERVDRRRLCTVQSDVFSMGVVLWECIAGRRLFRGEQPIETLQDIMSAPIPSLRKLGISISEQLDDVILKSLARDLTKRFESAEEFTRALEGACPDLATHAEVAVLVETVFGDRMRVRHEQVREALGEQADFAFVNTGLTPREAPTPEMKAQEEERLANVAPLAPSERYAVFENEAFEPATSAPRPIKKILAVAAGVVVVALLFFLLRDSSPTPTPSATQAPPASPSPSPPPTTKPVEATRHVVVPLPFPAVRVELDEQARDLAPPAESISFDVPREAAIVHRVTVTGTDGTKAQAFVREQDGIAKPQGDGFMIDEPVAAGAGGEPSSSSTPRRKLRAPRPTASGKPATSVKDGFTKLR